MPDEGGNQRGHQWPSVEVPPSSVVISGSASLISGHQRKCLGRVRARSAVADVGVSSGGLGSSGVGFGRGFGFGIGIHVPTRRLRPAAPTTSCAMSRCGMCGAT